LKGGVVGCSTWSPYLVRSLVETNCCDQISYPISTPSDAGAPRMRVAVD